MAPIANGRRYKKFFLKSLKIEEQDSNNLSYIPKITQNTPELTPGKIAPKPISSPMNKFLKKICIKKSPKTLYSWKIDLILFWSCTNELVKTYIYHRVKGGG